jgi:cation transporter-like permease
MATIVDIHSLWQTIWTAAVGGIGVSIVFALAVLGATRASDIRRAGGRGDALPYAALAVAGTLVALGAAVYAIVLIADR